MPRRLLDRARPDSVREFRAAARERFADGLALAAAGRRTGAIYLWGYSAEMTLKAAYFTLTGLGEADPITLADHLFPAIERGRKTFRLDWPRPGAGHNVRAWSELLIAERSARGVPYPLRFRRALQRRGGVIELLWRETLRYNPNVAYPHEVGRVRETAEWLLTRIS